jgi:hypothetical protein
MGLSSAVMDSRRVAFRLVGAEVGFPATGSAHFLGGQFVLHRQPWPLPVQFWP